MLIAFSKPYGVVSQFTPEHSGQRTLAEFGFPPGVYPLGRLDADSEGLLLLSDEPGLNTRLLHPRRAHPREYWAQVERIPAPETLAQLARGVRLGDHRTRPCRVWILDPQPEITGPILDGVSDVPSRQTAPSTVPCPAVLPPRDPPIRFRKTVPTCWIGLELVEGKNRQVRRMTAAVGHPTLRLVRVRIGNFWLGDLLPGQWRAVTAAERALIFAAARSTR